MKKYGKIIAFGISALLCMSICLEKVPFEDNNKYRENNKKKYEIEYSQELMSKDEMDKTIAAQTLETFRNTVDYAENEALIIMEDIRKKNDTAVYMDISDTWVQKKGITYIECVSEVINAEYQDLVQYYVTYKVKFNGNVWDKVDELNKDKNVISAEPNIICSIDDVYSSTEYIVGDRQWHYESLNMSYSWDKFKAMDMVPGQNVTVAVIDTGVKLNHEAIKGILWVNEDEIASNGIDDDNNGYIDDVHGISTVKSSKTIDDDSESGHGTHIAGTIAMPAINGIGTGIAYGSKIMAVKASDKSGNLLYADIIKGINYAANNGADILNLSFGGANTNALESAIRGAYNKGCIIIGAAGNDGAPTSEGAKIISKKYDMYDIYPAASKYVVGVMAYGPNDLFAEYSNWDYTNSTKYSVVAPGTNIVGPCNRGGYVYKTGTSMATAVASGVAACLKSYFVQKKVYSREVVVAGLHGNDTITYVDENNKKHTYKKLDVKLGEFSIRDCNISLSQTNFAYTGKYKVPTVTVKDSGQLLVKNVHYKLTYVDNKEIGMGYVRVTGIGQYTGAKNKCIYILPPTTKITAIKSVNKSTLKLAWNKQNLATGYEIWRYNSKTSAYQKIKTIAKNSTITYTDKSLKAGTVYQYVIRTYKNVDGKSYASSWSNKASMVTCPEKTSIKNSYKRTRNSIKLYWNKQSTATGYQVWRYNTKTKKYVLLKNINKNTTLSYTNTGLKKGTSYIYKVRTYKKYGGKYYFGEFSPAKTIRTAY